MVDFKIGADPEFFLLDTETGKHVSAFGMIPGTKHDPFEVEGGAVQVDGMALEFNINPATSFIEFEKNIGQVLKQLREMVPVRYKFDFVPVAHFGQEYIDSQSDEAKALGCDPDFNAWQEGAINPKPDGNRGIRTASGHIHVGWTQDQDVTDYEHIQACIMATKQLDYYLGIPSLLFDTDSTRRSMYGAPGAFRPKRYGVEYRVLSNFWVDNPSARSYVYHQTMVATQQLLSGKQVYKNMTSNYINYIFNYGSNHEIRDMIFGYLKHSRDDNLNFMERAYISSKNKGRKERVEYDRLMKDGWFLHNKTSTLVPYEDVDQEEYMNGYYQNPHRIYIDAISAGLPKPKFIDNYKPELVAHAPAKGLYPGQNLVFEVGGFGKLKKAVKPKNIKVVDDAAAMNKVLDDFINGLPVKKGLDFL